MPKPGIVFLCLLCDCLLPWTAFHIIYTAYLAIVYFVFLSFIQLLTQSLKFLAITQIVCLSFTDFLQIAYDPLLCFPVIICFSYTNRNVFSDHLHYFSAFYRLQIFAFVYLLYVFHTAFAIACIIFLSFAQFIKFAQQSLASLFVSGTLSTAFELCFSVFHSSTPACLALCRSTPPQVFS